MVNSNKSYKFDLGVKGLISECLEHRVPDSCAVVILSLRSLLCLNPIMLLFDKSEESCALTRESSRDVSFSYDVRESSVLHTHMHSQIKDITLIIQCRWDHIVYIFSSAKLGQIKALLVMIPTHLYYYE